jgi:hypothetical protein
LFLLLLLLLYNMQCGSDDRMNIERWIGKIWKEAAGA